MSQSLSQPALDGAPSALAHAARHWLQAPATVVQWWSPHAGVFEQGPEVLQAELGRQQPGQVLRVFSAGDFLPVLQQLNSLVDRLACAGVQTPGPVWVLEQAERLAQEHLDLLCRTCLNYPELGLRVALLSHCDRAPVAIQGMRVEEIELSKEDPVQTQERWVSSQGGAAQQPWLVWVLGGATVVLSGMLLLQAIRMASSGRAEVSVEPVTAAPAPLPVPAHVSVPAPVNEAPPAAQQASAPETTSLMASAPGPLPADAKASAARRWLTGLPPDSLLVAHARLGSWREAEAFRAGKAVLANARIFQILPAGEAERYLVVTGPFRSAERAQNHIQRLEWKNRATSMSREELLRVAR